jgi:hypothetical protein
VLNETNSSNDRQAQLFLLDSSFYFLIKLQNLMILLLTCIILLCFSYAFVTGA